MNKIYKYRLPRDGEVVTINDHVIEWLHVGTQNGVPTAWGVVDMDNSLGRQWEIVAWGTGWELPDEVWMDCEYIGTCEDAYGYVWHYFARYSDKGNGMWEDTAHAYAYASDIATVSVDYDTINKVIDSLATRSYTLEADALNGVINYVTAADCACGTGSVSFARG